MEGPLMWHLYDDRYRHPPYQNGYAPFRPFPEIHPDILAQSANASKKLMADVNTVLDKLTDSSDFNTNLMTAGQQSDTEEVKRLLQSLQLMSDFDVHYNLDGIRIEDRKSVV